LQKSIKTRKPKTLVEKFGFQGIKSVVGDPPTVAGSLPMFDYELDFDLTFPVFKLIFLIHAECYSVLSSWLDGIEDSLASHATQPASLPSSLNLFWPQLFQANSHIFPCSCFK
jgi:hypothetical protein